MSLDSIEAARLKDKLGEFLALQLPDFDHMLAALQVKLQQRPLKAASMVVEHCIVQVKGDTKEHYFDKPWFGIIYRATERWYEERYGRALRSSQSKVVHGVVSVFNTPFELAVPLTVREEVQPDGAFWVGFPNSVLPGERVLDWIGNPPNLEKLTLSEREAVSVDVVRIAQHLRATCVNLMTADYPDCRSQKLSQSIVLHLEKGAKDIVRDPRGLVSIAIWEFHLAAEKAIKVYLLQKGINPPRTHNLDDLNCLSGAGTESVASKRLVSKLPAGAMAIRYRYGEAESPDFAGTIEIYLAALELIDHYTRGLTRRFTFNNARFLLKAPPWMEMRGLTSGRSGLGHDSYFDKAADPGR